MSSLSNMYTSTINNTSNEKNLKSPKKNFSTKYKHLAREIAEVTQNNTTIVNDSFVSKFSPKKENEHYKIFTANLDKQKNESTLNQQLFRAKFSILTGKTLDNISFKKINPQIQTNKNTNSNRLLNNPLYSSYSKRNLDNNLYKKTMNIDITESTIDNSRSEKALKSFKKFLNKKPEIIFSSKILSDLKQKDNNKNGLSLNTISNYNNEKLNHHKNLRSRLNNGIVNKIKMTFPEYMDVKNKGQSYILNSDVSLNQQKISQLKNQILKI